MLDLAVAILGLLALIGILVTIIRKFPAMAAINTKVIPEERQNQLKAKLFEQRLERKLRRALSTATTRVKPFGRIVSRFASAQYQRVLELERRYKTRVDRGVVENGSPIEAGQRVEKLLGEARALSAGGNLDQAERQAIAAITLDPHSVPAYRFLAEVYLEQRNYEDARQTLTFLIDRLKVQDDEVYAELGQAASGEGKFEEAKTDLEQSIALNSQVAQHHLDLARVHLAIGDSAAAFESAKRAVELEPNNPKFLDAMVDISIIAGKRDWANETLEKLGSVNPENQKLAEFRDRISALKPTASRRRPAAP